MAGFMELALSAGFHATGRLLQVEDLVIDRAIVVAQGQPQRVQTVLSPNDNGFTCRVMQRDEEGWQTRATCRLSPAERSLMNGGDMTAPEDEQQLIELATLYRRYREFGLYHGPAFQKLSRLWAGDGEAWGEVIAEPRERSYLVHPTVLDACLQVVAGTLDSSQQRAWLPVRLSHYWVASAAAKPDRLRVHAQVRSAPGASGLNVDFVLQDDDDELVAVVKELVFEPVAARLAEQLDSTSSASRCEAAWKQQILQQPPQQRTTILKEYLLGSIANVLGLPVGDIPVDKPLGQLGLDSMMAYELQQELLDSLGLQVPMEEFLQDRTLHDWSQRLLARLEATAQAADDSSAEATVVSARSTNSHVVEGAI
jgi:acyl carrier protein